MIQDIPLSHAAPSRFHPASSPDYIPPVHLRWLQSSRLRQVVRRAYDHVSLYHRRMEERNLTPDEVCGLEDLVKLPFTVKGDLRDTYPFGMFASPMGEVVRLHASSGTTGKPIVVAYTASDLGVWTNVMVRALASFGLHRGNVIQNAYGYGLFTGGLGFHYGGEALGATVIPVSGGNTDRQIMVMRDFGVSAICCTPSYFLHIIDRAAEMGVDPRGWRFGPASSAPSRGPSRCGCESRKRRALRRLTFTGSLRLSVPALQQNVVNNRDCTYSRITSIRRSSIPRPAPCCPTAK